MAVGKLVCDNHILVKIILVVNGDANDYCLTKESTGKN